MPERAVTARAAVVGVGARTHNGLTALQVAMSCRAGLMDPVASHIVDRHGEPIATCRLMTLGDRLQGLERLEAMAAPALQEALAPYAEAVAEGRAQASPLPLLVAMPEETRADVAGQRHQPFVEGLCRRVSLPLDTRESGAIWGGRHAGIETFLRALHLLKEGARAVVVGGVDSYFHPDVLEALDEARRLHGLETENGFIPGEGAGFVVLAREDATAGIRPFGHLLSAASTEEPHPWHPLASPEAEPCLGVGMTRAVELASRASDVPIGWIVSDVNNERHRVDEWTFAWLRNARVFDDEATHSQPTLETGELGAASAAVLMAIACSHWRSRSAAASNALIAIHAEGPGRGALMVTES